MTTLDIVNDTTAEHHPHATELPSHEATKRCSRYWVAISGAEYNRIPEQVEAKEEARHRSADRSHRPSPNLLRRASALRRVISFSPSSGIGHNRGEPIDRIDRLTARLEAVPGDRSRSGLRSSPEPTSGTSPRPRWAEPRILLRPRPGFYVMRLKRAALLVPALIYQLCPMVIPQPTAVGGPHPDEWCRPLDRSPRYGALIDGKRVAIDRVWMAGSLRPVNLEEYKFRMGPLRRWAQANAMPEARPYQPVDFTVLPPLI
jgi:hypothetical protein